jgi:hypothetical protein
MLSIDQYLYPNIFCHVSMTETEGGEVVNALLLKHSSIIIFCKKGINKYIVMII